MLAMQPLTEPVAVEDLYVDRLCGIEDAADGQIRFTFGASRRSSYDGNIETIVVARPTLIWHTIKLTMEHFGRRCCGAVTGRELRH